MEVWYINLGKIIVNPSFSDLFKLIVNRVKRAGYTRAIWKVRSVAS